MPRIKKGEFPNPGRTAPSALAQQAAAASRGAQPGILEQSEPRRRLEGNGCRCRAELFPIHTHTHTEKGKIANVSMEGSGGRGLMFTEDCTSESRASSLSSQFNPPAHKGEILLGLCLHVESKERLLTTNDFFFFSFFIEKLSELSF